MEENDNTTCGNILEARRKRAIDEKKRRGGQYNKDKGTRKRTRAAGLKKYRPLCEKLHSCRWEAHTCSHKVNPTKWQKRNDQGSEKLRARLVDSACPQKFAGNRTDGTFSCRALWLGRRHVPDSLTGVMSRGRQRSSKVLDPGNPDQFLGQHQTTAPRNHGREQLGSLDTNVQAPWRPTLHHSNFALPRSPRETKKKIKVPTHKAPTVQGIWHWLPETCARGT